MNEYDKDGILATEKHVFFYKNKCPFSNFYKPCNFLYTYFNKDDKNTRLSSCIETHRFFSSEQAFMWHKARFFHDYETAKKILFEGNNSPKFCKDQGRLVQNYDDEAWAKVRYGVFRQVNLEKFSQDEKLKEFILDERFDGKTFVEASPSDAIWGIHMKIDEDGIDDERNWRGQNLLGKCITEVREMIKNGRKN